MSEDKKSTSTGPTFINANRRGFLQGAAVASGVAATGVASAVENIDVAAQTTEVIKGNKGYELNDYRRQYYKRARQ